MTRCQQWPPAKRTKTILLWIWLGLGSVVGALGQDAISTNTGPSDLLTNTAPPPPPPSFGAPIVAPFNSPAAETAASGLLATPPTATIGTGLLPSPLTGTSAISGFAPMAQGSQGSRPVFSYGLATLHVAVGDTLEYSGGLQFAPGHSDASWINVFSPSLVLDLGSHWVLTYGPTVTWYSQPGFGDTIGQSLGLTGATTYKEWAFSLAETYAHSSTPLVETGAQTSQDDYGTSIGVSRQIGSDLSWQLSLSQNIRDAEGFGSDNSWLANNSLEYAILPQVAIGPSVLASYYQTGGPSDMASESYEAEVFLTPGSRLQVSFSGGVSVSQFVNANAPNMVEPVFSGAIGYKLTESTSVSLNASRTIAPSFFAGLTTVSTQIGGSISHTIYRNLNLSVSGGYGLEQYTQITPEPPPRFWVGPVPQRALATLRVDTVKYISATLSWPIGQHLNASVFVSKAENKSSQDNFTFSSLQEGISLNYNY